MSVCGNCGNTIQPQQTFCKSCGTKISVENQTRSVAQNKSPISNRVKWIVAGVLLLVIGLFVANSIMSNMYKPEKTIEQFEQAVNHKDYKTLRKVLAQGGAPVTLSDKELGDYVLFLKDDKSLHQIVNELKQNAAGMGHFKKLSPITDASGNKLLVLEKGPKKLGIYQQYFINVYPFTVKVGSNLDNTEIFLNGKKVKKMKRKDSYEAIGGFLPGTYSLKAAYKGDYTSLDATKKIDFSESENNTVHVDMELDGHFISIYSNGDQAEIYANEKDTGKKIEDIDSFGPVPVDGSVELYAVLNHTGGPVKSNKVKIVDDSEVYLNFKEIQDEEKKAQAAQQTQDALDQYSGEGNIEKMKSFMEGYLAKSVQAINQQDFYLVESYLSPNGKSYGESKSYIDYLYSKGITEEFLNVDVLNVERIDKGFRVKTREDYTIYYDDGDSSKEKVFEATYTIVGNDSGLQIFKLDNVKEVSSINNATDYD